MKQGAHFIVVLFCWWACLGVGSDVQAGNAPTPSLDNYPPFPPDEVMQRMTTLYNQLQDQEHRHEYEAAVATIEKITASGWPFELDRMFLWIRQAQLYRRTKSPEKALALLANLEDKTEANHPLYPELMFNLGEAVVDGGDLAKGRAIFAELIHRFEQSEAGQHALLTLGRMDRKDKNYDDAYRYYDRYLSTYLGRRERPRILREMVELCLDAGWKEKAAGKADQLWSEVSSYPEAARTALSLARTFKEHGDAGKALLYAQAASGGSDAGAQEAACLVGQLQRENGDEDAARTAYEHAIRNFPLSALSVSAYRQASALLAKKGVLCELPDFPQTPQTDDLRNQLMLLYGEAALDLKQFDTALAALEKIHLTKASDQRKLASALAQCYMKLAETAPDPQTKESYRVRILALDPLPSAAKAALKSLISDRVSPESPAINQRLLALTEKTADKLVADLLGMWVQYLLDQKSVDLANRLIDQVCQQSGKGAASDFVNFRLTAILLSGDLERAQKEIQTAIEKSLLPPDDLARIAKDFVDALLAAGLGSDAVEFLLANADAIPPLGQARLRLLIVQARQATDPGQVEKLLHMFFKQYPAAADWQPLARELVDVSLAQQNTTNAWSVVERYLNALSDEEAVAFASYLNRSFADRGSPYVEPLNAFLLERAKSDEERWTAHNNLSQYYLKMQSYDKAVIHLEYLFEASSARSDADRMKAGTQLLKAAIAAGKGDDYICYLAAGIQQVVDQIADPKIKSQSSLQLAKVLQRAGMTTDAQTLYADVAEINPQTTTAQIALYNLAKSYGASDQTQKAIDAYLEYIDRYSSQTNTPWVNMAMANLLTLAMKSGDPAQAELMRQKAEAMLNGVRDPQLALDLAQYFGRQGHEDIQKTLVNRSLEEAARQIESAPDVETRNQTIETTVKRLMKMGYNEEAIKIGSKYLAVALGNDPSKQTSALYDAMYDRLRAQLHTRSSNMNELADEASRLLKKATELGYDDAQANLLYLLADVAKGPDRWAYREKLVQSHGSNGHALTAKILLAGKYYRDGNKDRALALAQDALAQAAQPFFADYEDRHRYNAIYIAAVLLEEQGQHREAELLNQELSKYDRINDGLYIKEYMSGTKLY